MARLPYIDIGTSDYQYTHPVPADYNIFRVMYHSPELARKFIDLGGWLRFDSSLDPRLRELAILQVGYCSRAEYEYAHHLEIGFSVGLTPADIEGLVSESNGQPSNLGALEKAVIGLARELAESIRVTPEYFATIREHLSEEHLVDLVMSISLYCGVVRFLAAFEVDTEPKYLDYLGRFPLPEVVRPT